MSAQRVVVTCPAKVNLALSVGAPDATGFHPIASWMLAVDLADGLELERADREPRFDIRFDDAPDSPTRGLKVDWPLERDLAVRAHGLLSLHAGRELAVHARLTKRIPAGGGLGGGSADAAGMLIALDRLFDLNLGLDALQRLGAELGSDVAFAVMAAAGACVAALATGRGELLQPMRLSRPLHLVLVFPPFGCPTAKVYAALDAMRGPAAAGQRPDVQRVRALTSAAALAVDGPFNDLAAPAQRVQPRLADLRQRVTELARRPAHVTGSGSTLFLVADDPASAARLAALIEEQLSVRTAPVSALR